jgi:hypothetical protein
MSAELRLTWGKVFVKTLRLSPRGFKPTRVEVTLNDKPLPARLALNDDHASIALSAPAAVSVDERLRVELK